MHTLQRAFLDKLAYDLMLTNTSKSQTDYYAELIKQCNHQNKNTMNIKMIEYKGPCGLIKIVEQLELCKYQTKDGLHDLVDNLAFQALKELAQEQFDNYDGPQDGEAWSGGFAENH